MAASAGLTVMPDGERQRLVSEYVEQGGGLASFLARESEAFLAFLDPRLGSFDDVASYPRRGFSRLSCQAASRRWNDYMHRLTDWERNHTLDV
jgi:hypothetical protein